VTVAQRADPDAHSLRGLRARVRSQAAPETAPWATLAVRDLPFGVVVIDRRYDIRAINGAARRLLGIHGPAVGEDLLHAGALPYADLRPAIDRALREGGTVTLGEVVLDRAPLGPRLALQVSCSRLPGQGGQGERDDAVLLLVHDVTPAADVRLAHEREREALRVEVARLEAEGRRRAETIARLEEDLRRAVAANRELLEANQELNSLNEELRTTNEDLLLHAEEAQASAEEVETLNEELQATNEELETLNEELQATVEELNTANEELRARALEAREQERAGGARAPE
jgi:two-component system CheB/CheR fusion protein